jgi:hypothetical protein
MIIMKIVSGLLCISVFFLSCLPIYGQQPNTKLLRNYELVDLPFQVGTNLIGTIVENGQIIKTLSPDKLPEFEENLSLEDLTFQKDGSTNINAGATIFSFLNARFKKANSKFQLTQMPNIKIVRAKSVPAVLESLGRDSGKVITAYLIADGFTLCSDKVNELIAQASLLGGSAVTPENRTSARNCKEISNAALTSVTTGTMPIAMPTATPPSPDINVATENVKRNISQIVQEEFAKLGLQNISASVDIRSHTVTVASTSRPVIVAWQVVKYDPSPNKIRNTTIQGNFLTSNMGLVNDRTSSNYDRNLPSYQIQTGVWTQAVRNNYTPELSDKCVYFKVIDMATNTSLIPVTYCPQTDELPNMDLTGYLRNPEYVNKTSMALPTFLRQGKFLVRPRLTINSPIFAIHPINGVQLFANIRIDEEAIPFSIVKK